MENNEEDKISEISNESSKTSRKKTITFVDSESVNLSDRTESISTVGLKTYARRSSAELAQERKNIKSELTKVSQGFNLLIFMVYIQLCANWYLIGVQWLPYKLILPEIECNIPQLRKVNWTFYERRNITNPKNRQHLPGCFYNDLDYDKLANLTYEEAINFTKYNNELPILKCKNYIFKHDVPKEISPIREFNKFCIRRTFMSPSVYGQSGVAVFAFSNGLLADIYGRRPVYIACSIISTFAAAILASSPNFVIFSIAKFMLSGSLVSMNIVLVIIYSELYRHRWRPVNTILSFLFLILGFSFTQNKNINIMAVEVWRLNAVVFTLSVLILVFGATMITVESPRFLMKKRQFKKVWDCLRELGQKEIKPGVVNYEFPKSSLKYQLKIFTKIYFLHRIYTVLILNGVSIAFIYLFMTMKGELIMPPDTKLQLKLILVEIFMLAATAIISIFFSKKILVTTYYTLLGFCLLINVMVNEVNDLTAFISRAAFMFSLQIYILNYAYLIEVFPTSHRATSLGFYFSIIHVPQIFVVMFKEEWELDKEFKFFSGFYCGLCVICVLISLVSPDSSIELPDRKQDLFVKLSLSSNSILRIHS